MDMLIKPQSLAINETILIVDDEQIVIDALKHILQREGYQAVTANSGRQAIEEIRSQPIALIICDLQMQGITGIEVLTEAQRLQPDAIRIILTGYSDLKTVLNAVNIGHASQIILKPWDNVFLLQTVESSLEKYRLIKENQNLQGLALQQHKDLTYAHETLRHQLLLGGRIHETLLVGKIPKNIPGFFIEALSIPSSEIDGDFFEFYQLNSGILDVVIGDVMGKGIPAALVGTALKTHLLHFAVPISRVQRYEKQQGWQENVLAPEEILTYLHKELVSKLIYLEYFASIFYGRFDLQNCTFTYVDCGSTKPIHYKANEKQAVLLKGSNLPLGTIEEEIYVSTKIQYAKNDFFIFYSDGLSEAKSPEKKMYGHQHLIKIAEDNPEASASELLNLIKSSVIAFSEKQTFADDLTILIIKINEVCAVEQFKLVTAKFNADLSQLSAVRKFIDRMCYGIPGNLIVLSEHLQLAINEVFCNIVKHGYKGEKGHEILIRVRVGEEGITVELSDQGMGFNPTEIEEPSLVGDQDHGYGWYIIRELADYVTYIQKESERGWNHMYLYKKYVKDGKKMQFSHSTNNNILIITPEGESLDAHDAPEFKQQVVDLIQTNSLNRVVLDLHQLQFIDSSGLGSFLSVLRLLHSSGGELKLACMNKPVRTVFELISMHKIFEIFNTTEEAVKSF
jgi:phosphoserine phosphatase RsbU/P